MVVPYRSLRIGPLVDLVPLDTPVELGGIGHGVMVTHRGQLRFLPDHIALCYYSPSAQATLISLGFLQSQGASYASHGLGYLRMPTTMVLCLMF